jgi:catechol 2,3-dioxygenase-like lactoylglutathione lyase family enzyme
MAQEIGYVAVVVRDYDEALAYFTKVLGFELVEDTSLDREKRWVLVAPPGSQSTRLLLARAVTTEQASRVGNQTGGRVFLFLHTDNLWRDYHAMKERIFGRPRVRNRTARWRSLKTFTVIAGTCCN